MSPVTSTRPELTLLTRDNADSQQYNETRWFIDILDGTAGHDPHGEHGDHGDDDDDDGHGRDEGRGDGRIDPNSGIPSAACPGTACSRYDGVRDSGQSVVAPDGGLLRARLLRGPERRRRRLLARPRGEQGGDPWPRRHGPRLPRPLRAGQ